MPTPDNNYVHNKGTIFVAPGGGGAPTPLEPGADGQALFANKASDLGVEWGTGTGMGNVVGPVSSVAHHLAAFADTSGELLEDSGIATALVAQGVAGPVVSGNFASFNGTGGKQLQDSGSAAASFSPAKGPAGGQIIKVTSPAGDYAALLTDYLILATSSAARAITLPTAPPDGTTFIVKDKTGTAGTNNITVAGAVNIDGAATNVIATNYGHVKYTYSTTATLWYTS
jgi:hypothetical protein